MTYEPSLLTFEHSTGAQISWRFLADPTSRGFVEMYEEVLRPCFPDPNDLDDFDAIASYVRCSRSAADGRFMVLCAFADERPVGVTIFSVVCSPKLSLMRAQYTAVRQSSRRQGLGRALCEARDTIAHALAVKFAARPLDLSCIASVDPTKLSPGVAAKQLPAPTDVERLWRGLGYRKAIFDFIQVPLSDEKSTVKHLALWVKTWSPHYAARDYLLPGECSQLAELMNAHRRSTLPLAAYPDFRDMSHRLRVTKSILLD